MVSIQKMFFKVNNVSLFTINYLVGPAHLVDFAALSKVLSVDLRASELRAVLIQT